MNIKKGYYNRCLFNKVKKAEKSLFFITIILTCKGGVMGDIKLFKIKEKVEEIVGT